ncbi:MAG: hypothetical protein ACR2HH_15305, partial [Chthoniobacterales bacterium]
MNPIAIELRSARGALIFRRTQVLRALQGLDHDLKVGFATGPPDAFRPERDVNIVHEVGKAVAAYRHDLSQLAIDQVQLSPIQPEAAAILAML